MIANKHTFVFQVGLRAIQLINWPTLGSTAFCDIHTVACYSNSCLSKVMKQVQNSSRIDG